MRDFNCACTFFNAGLLAMKDAIGLPAFPKPVQSPLGGGRIRLRHSTEVLGE
jgi:hypothetical protein